MMSAERWWNSSLWLTEESLEPFSSHRTYTELRKFTALQVFACVCVFCMHIACIYFAVIISFIIVNNVGVYFLFGFCLFCVFSPPPDCSAYEGEARIS